MSDLDKKYPLRLDTRIDFKNLIPHFYVSDNETSDFYIKFTNDNQPVSVENVVIAIVVVNPNSQINSSLLDVNIDKGLIYCNLPNELKNVVGVYKAKIMCISEEERLVSNTFEYKVDMDEFAILNEVVENSDEILLLTQMLSQINVISTEEGKRIENENIRLVNETERTTNETNRINNEDERKSNELERIANETKRNNDENERQLKEAERNENELNRESQELIRQNNEVDRTAYDEVLSNNEEERMTNESDRIAHEESRANSENIRINNENNRERNEQIRQNNEENRKFEFTMQSQSLTELSMGVNAVKEDILRSESNRKSSEDERKSNEELRIDNEDVRITNEEARVKNEDTRLKSEEIRVSNEDTRERSENTRKTNENTRVSNENKRITAESTRSSNENIRVNAENRRRNEHTARMAEIDEALANLPNSLPIANQTTLGGIKVGAGLSITSDGVLSATGGGTADGVAGITEDAILNGLMGGKKLKYVTQAEYNNLSESEKNASDVVYNITDAPENPVGSINESVLVDVVKDADVVLDNSTVAKSCPIRWGEVPEGGRDVNNILVASEYYPIPYKLANNKSVWTMYKPEDSALSKETCYFIAYKVKCNTLTMYPDYGSNGPVLASYNASAQNTHDATGAWIYYTMRFPQNYSSYGYKGVYPTSVYETSQVINAYAINVEAEYATKSGTEDEFLTQMIAKYGGLDLVPGQDLSANPVLTSYKSDNTVLDTATYGTDNEINVEAKGKLSISSGSARVTIEVSALHTHKNMDVLNSITTEKIASWDNKSDFDGNYGSLNGAPTSLPANGGNSSTVGGYSIWAGTQAEYEAISTKSNTTIYFIKEG